jgi:hypothetical protein
VALIIDGNHLVRARNLTYGRGPEKFANSLYLWISRIMKDAMANYPGLKIGYIRFHQGEPLDLATAERLSVDAKALEADVEQTLRDHRTGYLVNRLLEQKKKMDGVPFELVTGYTQYQGFYLPASRVHTDQPTLPLIRQKQVDTNISLDIVELAAQPLINPDVIFKDGMIIAASDKDFVPAIARAHAFQAEHMRRGVRFKLYWAKLEADDDLTCPYEKHIPPEYRFRVRDPNSN